MAVGGSAKAPTCIPVREYLDVFEARRIGRTLATSLGFGVQAREELVILISELGSNIIKYGVSGDITLERIDEPPHGLGIRVTARDVRPPIADLQLALTDGYTDRGPIDPLQLLHRKGFGAGLGAIVRFSDSFEVLPGEGEKRIRVVRWLRRPKPPKPF